MAKGNDFEIFKKEFTYYQKLFGLTGYKVYFKSEHFEDCFADITIDHKDSVATVRLNDTPSPDRHVKDSAKHEALHLLFCKIESLADNRYIRKEEVSQATEELVFKLENLIQ